jgi:hypothetical protein
MTAAATRIRASCRTVGQGLAAPSSPAPHTPRGRLRTFRKPARISVARTIARAVWLAWCGCLRARVRAEALPFSWQAGPNARSAMPRTSIPRPTCYESCGAAGSPSRRRLRDCASWPFATRRARAQVGRLRGTVSVCSELRFRRRWVRAIRGGALDPSLADPARALRDSHSCG